MTTDEIITLYEALIDTHVDSYDTTGTDATKVVVLNRAQKIIARAIRFFDPKITWTLTASTAEYKMADSAVFSKEIRKPYNVYLNSKEITLYQLNEFLLMHKDYRWNNTAGTPTCAYWHVGTMGLHVQPDAAAAAYTCYVSGECYPAAMSAADAPALATINGLPGELHEAIAYLGAVLAGQPTASDETSLYKLGQFNNSASAIMSEVRDMNESLILGDFNTSHEKYIS
jgi:hypothetical protein